MPLHRIEDPAFLAECALDARLFPGQLLHLLEGPSRGQEDVLQDLGDPLHGRARQLGERPAAAQRQGQDLEGGHDAVAGRAVVQEDEVPGLLAARG